MARETQAVSEVKKSAKNNGEGGEWKELPEPIFTDGYFVMEEGNEIQGGVLEREEGQFGGVYKIKTSAPTKAKNRDGVKMFPKGSVIGVNENAKLKKLQAPMKQGPIMVQIHVDGERQGGPGWELTVKHRPAF